MCLVRSAQKLRAHESALEASAQQPRSPSRFQPRLEEGGRGSRVEGKTQWQPQQASTAAVSTRKFITPCSRLSGHSAGCLAAESQTASVLLQSPDSRVAFRGSVSAATQNSKP